MTYETYPIIIQIRLTSRHWIPNLALQHCETRNQTEVNVFDILEVNIVSFALTALHCSNGAPGPQMGKSELCSNLSYLFGNFWWQLIVFLPCVAVDCIA